MGTDKKGYRKIHGKLERRERDKVNWLTELQNWTMEIVEIKGPLVTVSAFLFKLTNYQSVADF